MLLVPNWRGNIIVSQLEERVRHLFGVSIESKLAIADSLSPVIAHAGQCLANCLLNDGKILICGHGGSAANCLHFSTSLLNHFEVERPSLPVLALCTDGAVMTGVSNEGHAEQMFSRQIRALGQEGDVLIALTTSGNSNGILHAVDAANERGMDTIVLNGRDGGVLANHLGPEDIEMRIPGDTSSRILEVHLFILHCFCDLIDQQLFGQMQE